MIKKGALIKAVKQYNKYHGAEAHVKVVKQFTNLKDHLLVRFEGPFCLSCAPDEYYADFQMLLQDLTGIEMKINSVKTGKGIIVDYELIKT